MNKEYHNDKRKCILSQYTELKQQRNIPGSRHSDQKQTKEILNFTNKLPLSLLAQEVDKSGGLRIGPRFAFYQRNRQTSQQKSCQYKRLTFSGSCNSLKALFNLIKAWWAWGWGHLSGCTKRDSFQYLTKCKHGSSVIHA